MSKTVEKLTKQMKKEVLLSKLECYESVNNRFPKGAKPFSEKEVERVRKQLHKLNAKEETTKPTFILVSGKAQNGKDTTASILCRYLEHSGKNVLIIHYADLLKYICEMYFGWDRKKDERGRTLLQEIGTDNIRKNYPDFWVKFVADFVMCFPNRWDYVIVPDTRFPNEVSHIRDRGFNAFLLRVNRGGGFVSPLSEEQQKHASETALDNADFDFVIHNDGTLEDLRVIVGEVSENIELLSSVELF